jgi:hypothetical protein
METVLAGLQWDICLIYLDDVIIYRVGIFDSDLVEVTVVHTEPCRSTPDAHGLVEGSMTFLFSISCMAVSYSQMSGAKWFCVLDLCSGYWQVECHPKDRPKTAFVTRRGLYQFQVMPFGLCNAPATFERLMETVLAGLQWDICLIYLDDVIIYGKNFDEMSTYAKALQYLRILQ